MHLVRLAASRTFCTAGSNSPISTPMMAITTSSSISVKPCRGERERRDGMDYFSWDTQSKKAISNDSSSDHSETNPFSIFMHPSWQCQRRNGFRRLFSCGNLTRRLLHFADGLTQPSEPVAERTSLLPVYGGL